MRCKIIFLAAVIGLGLSEQAQAGACRPRGSLAAQKAASLVRITPIKDGRYLLEPLISKPTVRKPCIAGSGPVLSGQASN